MGDFISFEFVMEYLVICLDMAAKKFHSCPNSETLVGFKVRLQAEFPILRTSKVCYYPKSTKMAKQ